ncbi:DNA recombination protein RmuC [Marinihelvus fidelis]|uniref:DNA recombination protein RmuC n=1 Tax=Marinihelvus fidelis TaxID=2613842 RepID=A0A5N0T5C8_9GAMM|nr:DNA recombination protein RmuC [Marinihelvus fidelis]KAA9129684.1 DNA recombination protein RmuC [Marinihelvus fidelis]
MDQYLIWATFIAASLAFLFSIATVVLSGRPNKNLSREVREELRTGREESRSAGKELREEVSRLIQSASTNSIDTLNKAFEHQLAQLSAMTQQLKELEKTNRESLDNVRSNLDRRVIQLQENNEAKIGKFQDSMSDGLKQNRTMLSDSIEKLSNTQKSQLESVAKELRQLSDSNQQSLDRIRQTFDERVVQLQSSNEKKLDEMRNTVDEKLHDTLEKRLGESFKLVSNQLDAVHKGLGEMQSLATGVGDLKRVLTNVKARGTWAEVQLGSILEQVLTSEQFEKNVCTKPNTTERVEFAVRLPGPKDDPARVVYLPIDSKFPQEDYARLQDASEKSDPILVQTATDALMRSIKSSAKEIHDKYINPPETTDFAIMFLATEGLYAEVLRQPALVEDLQQNFRIVVAGPTTLVAILSSLRVGFQTLAIEKRASEVWRVLAAVKTEFGKFGGVLAKVKKQLNTASKTIDQTEVRTRAMERKLREVEHLPTEEANEILALDDSKEDAGSAEDETEDQPS